MELKRYDYAIQRLLPELLFRFKRGGMIDYSGSAEQGDIVMLQSAPDSEWHLSIYHQDCGDGYYLLESLKTGKMMRWGNVGILRLSPEWTAEHPRIRWTEKQFAFDRMFCAELKRGDYYIHIPYFTDFCQEWVTIATRTRFSLDDTQTRSEPMRWAAMKRADLRDAMARQVAEHRAAAEKRKEAAQRGEGE